MANIVEQGACGLAVPPDQPEQLADALVQMSLLTAAQRKEIGARAAKIAKECFAREKLAAQFVRVVCYRALAL